MDENISADPYFSRKNNNVDKYINRTVFYPTYFIRTVIQLTDILFGPYFSL